jgi:hypothetical protein
MYLKAFEHIMATWIQIVGLDHFVIPSSFYLTCTPETRTLVSPCRHDAISTAYASTLISKTCTLLESFALHRLACSCSFHQPTYTLVMHYAYTTITTTVSQGYHKGSAPELWAMRHNMRVLNGFGVKLGDQGASPHRDDFDTKLMRFHEWDQTLWGQIWRVARCPLILL